MRILCIRHVAFEGPGIIAEWAEEKGYDLEVVKIWLGETLPKAESLDGLIIMGGPMSAYDDDKSPWITDEKKLIANAIDLEIPVLGICLGAQIIANVLGAIVYPNKHKEIGWFPVELTESGKSHPIAQDLKTVFTTFHWHGDTFEIPPEATHLIRSSACRNQAFILGNTLALQFHMEMLEENIRELSLRCAHELVEAPYIATAESLSGNPAMKDNHTNLRALLNKWIVPALN
ncbi:MAG: type 1 glutamine amidotransferase [Bacteroidetes bacterium]|nr:type 1 glutamine amidotransferase [Bacteroidota bacterium]